MSAIYFVDTDNGWAVGTSGTSPHTTDGGTTWIMGGVELTTESLSGVHFTSPTNGYVVGNGNTIFKFVGDE